MQKECQRPQSFYLFISSYYLDAFLSHHSRVQTVKVFSQSWNCALPSFVFSFHLTCHQGAVPSDAS